MTYFIFVGFLLFWGMLLLILFTLIGFPIVLWIRARIWPVETKTQTDYFPEISILIAAYNEEDVIVEKLESVIASDYPQKNIEVIVASDGSTDNTNQLVENFGDQGVTLMALPRLGKNTVVSRLVEKAEHDLLVFTDADTILTPTTLKSLVAPFIDPHVGGVSGDYHYGNPKVKQEGERLYWNYDRLLKQLQTQAGSVSAASGTLYAIRKDHYRPVPKDVTDDFFIAMQVVSAHQRLVFEPAAIAYGPIASSASAEFKRKVRISTRGLRGIWLMRHLLNPLQYGFFAFQLFMHKVLRRLLVIPILVVFFASLILWNEGLFYRKSVV